MMAPMTHQRKLFCHIVMSAFDILKSKTNILNSSLNPILTVLMPVYNGEKYLNEAIDSILNQTFSDFEFLIINDGSTDNTEDIILSYSDPRIRYIKNEKNLKLIATLNKGLDLVQGIYIARMDADDISLPTRLEKQLNFLVNNQDYILVSSRISSFGSVSNFYSRSLTNDQIIQELLSNNCIYHSTVMLNKLLLKDEIYRSSFLHAEDYDLWTRICLLGKMIVLDEVLLKYRVHEDSISQSNYEQQYEMVKKIRSNILNNYLDFLTLEETLIYNRFLNSATNDYFIQIESYRKYDNFDIHMLSRILNKIKSTKESNIKLVYSKDEFIKYMRFLVFTEFIRNNKINKLNFFYYLLTPLFSLNQFSKKEIIKWLIKC